MKTLNVSFAVFKKIATIERVYFTEQTVWLGESVEQSTMYFAKNAGDDVVLSVCTMPKSQITVNLIADNRCDSEDDAIAMAISDL